LTDLVLPIPCAIFLFLLSGNIQFPYVFIIGLMLWITNPQNPQICVSFSLQSWPILSQELSAEIGDYF
ncbi:hypothetical protein ACG9ZJ_21750, partial [Acinetobacter sp. ULE_I064]|uniref:hypothetical protein n=1 Tax=Acinetobacter sp. ULE_I064 TaxID=3373071 RepID=UPI003AF65F03